MKKIPGVLFAEPNGRASFDVIPNDQYFSYQWALQSGGGTGKIQAPEAWDIYKGSSSTKIGIIDGGVDATHPDLNGKVYGNTTLYGYHGTHVAGIAAAKTNNTTGVAGVNWNAQILSEPFNDATSDGDPHLYNIITDAVNQGCNVLNNSWKLINDNGTPGRYSTTVRIAFAYAYKQNRVAVATIGNTGHTTNTVQYPGSFGQGIVTVGATEQDDARAYFSTYGNAIDVSAPGVSILSTYRNGSHFYDPNYEYLDGTSMAAPFVTGIASLLKGYNPNLSNDDIEQIIRLSADDVNSSTYPGWDQYLGTGRVNAYKALNLLRAPYQLSKLSAYGGSYYANTASYTTIIYGASGLADGVYIVERHEVRKNVSFPPHTNINVWGRGIGTTGWSLDSPNFSMGYCDVIPGSVTSTSATLRTYVYKVWNIAGQYLGYYPTNPENVTFAYTVHGMPTPYTFSVSISGPTRMYIGDIGTYEAHVSGGTPPYYYQWWRYDIGSYSAAVDSSNYITPNRPPFNEWYPLGTHRWFVDISNPPMDFNIKCVVTDSMGYSSTSNIINVRVYQEPFAADGNLLKNNIDTKEVPTNFSLVQNYPNPFNPITQINYALPSEAKVNIKVYDLLGREVVELVNEQKGAGFYTVNFNGSNLSSGIYLYRIVAQNGEKILFTESKRMILMK